jgi:hypothetical protein
MHQRDGSTVRVELRLGKWHWSGMSVRRWPAVMGKGSYSSVQSRGKLDMDQSEEQGRTHAAHRNGEDGCRGSPNVGKRMAALATTA